MLLRRKHSSRDHRRHESVAGRVVRHDVRDGYVYVQATRGDVIRALRRRGFEPVDEGGTDPDFGLDDPTEEELVTVEPEGLLAVPTDGSPTPPATDIDDLVTTITSTPARELIAQIEEGKLDSDLDLVIAYDDRVTVRGAAEARQVAISD